MTRNLSRSVIVKFIGYKILKHRLGRNEKREFITIDIVYEPVYDERAPVPCFFTHQIHLVYRSYIGQMRKGNENIGHSDVKQSHYCENYFAKNDENIKKHIQV